MGHNIGSTGSVHCNAIVRAEFDGARWTHERARGAEGKDVAADRSVPRYARCASRAVRGAMVIDGALAAANARRGSDPVTGEPGVE